MGYFRASGMVRTGLRVWNTFIVVCRYSSRKDALRRALL